MARIETDPLPRRWHRRSGGRGGGRDLRLRWRWWPGLFLAHHQHLQRPGLPGLSDLRLPRPPRRSDLPGLPGVRGLPERCPDRPQHLPGRLSGGGRHAEQCHRRGSRYLPGQRPVVDPRSLQRPRPPTRTACAGRAGSRFPASVREYRSTPGPTPTTAPATSGRWATIASSTTCSLNSPINYNDPTGEAADILIDAGFVIYDFGDIATSLIAGEGVSGDQLLALAGDLLGMAVPFLTGVGAAVRAGSHADDVVKVADDVVDAASKARPSTSEPLICSGDANFGVAITVPGWVVTNSRRGSVGLTSVESRSCRILSSCHPDLRAIRWSCRA